MAVNYLQSTHRGVVIGGPGHGGSRGMRARPVPVCVWFARAPGSAGHPRQPISQCVGVHYRRPKTSGRHQMSVYHRPAGIRNRFALRLHCAFPMTSLLVGGRRRGHRRRASTVAFPGPGPAWSYRRPRAAHVDTALSRDLTAPDAPSRDSNQGLADVATD